MVPKPIGEPDEITGQSALPISRVKKIIQLDEDIVQCSNNATFVIAMATMFIKHLAEQGYNVVKTEKKPRKTVQYKDLASAVSHTDNLEFLSDVIPKTTTYKQFKEKKAKDAADQTAMEKGQRTLNGASAPPPPPANGNSMGETSPKGEESSTTSPSVPRPMVPVSALIADRTVEPVATPDHDVEMQG
ncbi:unnamed protein product [Penicillium salamii]|uniref:Transcription factor CBF/NF-Y/archaeal histone domain-containing protein n=1 Tax=Penicillium salamii TaxID=1612424 RepID=A0A9W4J6U7_9EURO|nr:unnamed protein product [Penicillium salamii]CAG8093847.1 unnamed protein product [Penicillium salamii]CAG8097555.1 unnamed protein product [Penicillium salamii]CAG8139440.1 unnamed protein product [Penicillium salamii]CAG8193207.1 unnamed protein product [Penicillium salamii]